MGCFCVDWMWRLLNRRWQVSLSTVAVLLDLTVFAGISRQLEGPFCLTILLVCIFMAWFWFNHLQKWVDGVRNRAPAATRKLKILFDDWLKSG